MVVRFSYKVRHTWRQPFNLLYEKLTYDFFTLKRAA